ncbi:MULTISPECIES: hypothetical protein [unclassified Bradyrhizobium]
MVGLVEAAPIYLNGLAALLFVFILPGAVIVLNSALTDFSRRWLAVFLASLTTNYFAVSLIAQLNLNPLLTYRIFAAATAGILLYTTLRHLRTSPPSPGVAAIARLEAGWLLSSIVVLAITYINIWKYGVPHVFRGSDVSVSWDVWSLIWAKGGFPTASYGYPHLIPTLWAVAYIFTGSDVQYFPYYIFIVLIIAPLVLTTGILSRASAWLPAAALATYAWFIAEIRRPWLRETLQEGWPDWVAVMFCFCGILLFVATGPNSQTDDDQPRNNLLSLCMLLMAASIKPLYGLFAVTVLAAICKEAIKYPSPVKRTRTIAAAIGLVVAFAAAYAISYSHLTVRAMPNYPVAELSDRLSRAIDLFNTNFTVAFRVLIAAGVVLCPFLPQVRWFILPLLIGIGVWANTASYDLRNVLGFFLVSAFIAVYAVTRKLRVVDARPSRQWAVPDAAVLVGLAVLSIGLTLPLALDDFRLKERFATDQLRGGGGIAVNQKIGELLSRGCIVFESDAYVRTISAFSPYREQIQFFHYPEPLTAGLVERFNRSDPCKVIIFPPGATHPTILEFIRAAENSAAYRKVSEMSGPGFLVLERASD